MDEQIKHRLEEHKASARLSRPREYASIMLTGSQNYGLADEKSDIDSKLLILPSMADICTTSPLASYEHRMPNNEHCDVKDIRLIFSCWKKQNINFVEMLFTQYYIDNPVFAKWLNLLRDNREQIAHYDPHYMVESMYGQAYTRELMGSVSEFWKLWAEWRGAREGAK